MSKQRVKIRDNIKIEEYNILKYNIYQQICMNEKSEIIQIT